MSPSITFFVDFDNTLINNDKVKEKIREGLFKKFGSVIVKKFIDYYDKTREEKGYVNYLETIKRVSKELKRPDIDDELHWFFDGFDFRSCLFPAAENVLKHLKEFGKVVIFTEGDEHAQKVKIKRSGVWGIVSGQVEIPLIKKVNFILKLRNKYAADIYYVIDDKPEILKEIIDLKNKRLKTIHVCQGHYSSLCKKERFNLTVSSIDKLLEVNFPLQN